MGWPPLRGKPGKFRSCLEGHALALELLHPAVRALLGLVVLVVLVAEEAAELAVAERLGVRVVVVRVGRHADDRGALGREAVVELAGRVAEVVAVRALVAEAEDGHLLARHVEVREPVVEELVPGRARPLLVGAGVPRGRAADERVHGHERVVLDRVDVLRLEARGGRDVARDGLRVAGGRRVVEAHRVERRRLDGGLGGRRHERGGRGGGEGEDELLHFFKRGD
mmetsp:Transcript_17402/g.51905  ORF Transcript_17402/g.51905 Transcript_17402/m.51905 type:complete len:225 (+) Transcript_17402:34-708(+)